MPKLIRLRELPDWPPQPGGPQKAGTFFPTAGEAVINDIVPIHKSTVTFRGVFDNIPVSYHYHAQTESIARKIHAVIAANFGKTLAELGPLQIEV